MSSAFASGIPHSKALELAQKAPQFLEQQAVSHLLNRIPYVSSTESADLWMTYENLIFACLRTGDEKSAHLCLERLTRRFGTSNERVMGLRGLYQEAVVEDDAALESVLKEYGSLIDEDPTNMALRKRRIALLQSLRRTSEAVSALVELLDISPTDAEAWAELSSLYLSQGLYSQACFCLEEVLLICPNAWNIHARLGEILYMSSFQNSTSQELSTEKALTEGIRRYCRSIELCDGYLRGYYGLKISTDRLLEVFHQDSRSVPRSAAEVESVGRLPLATVKALNKKATTELEVIVRRKTAGDADYSGYDEAEVISAKALLDGNSPNT